MAATPAATIGTKGAVVVNSSTFMSDDGEIEASESAGRTVSVDTLHRLDPDQVRAGCEAAIRRHEELGNLGLAQYGEAAGLELQQFEELVKSQGFAVQFAQDAVRQILRRTSECPEGSAGEELEKEVQEWTDKLFGVADKFPSRLNTVLSANNESLEDIANNLRAKGDVYRTLNIVGGATVLNVKTYSRQLNYDRLTPAAKASAIQVQHQLVKALLLISFFYGRVLELAGVNVILWPLVPYMRIMRLDLIAYLGRVGKMDKLNDYFPASLVPENGGLKGQVASAAAAVEGAVGEAREKAGKLVGAAAGTLQGAAKSVKDNVASAAEQAVKTLKEEASKLKDELYAAFLMAEDECEEVGDKQQLKAELERLGCDLKAKLTSIRDRLLLKENQKKAPKQEGAQNSPGGGGGKRVRGGSPAPASPAPAPAPGTPGAAAFNAAGRESPAKRKAGAEASTPKLSMLATALYNAASGTPSKKQRSNKK